MLFECVLVPADMIINTTMLVTFTSNNIHDADSGCVLLSEGSPCGAVGWDGSHHLYTLHCGVIVAGECDKLLCIPELEGHH